MMAERPRRRAGTRHPWRTARGRWRGDQSARVGRVAPPPVARRGRVATRRAPAWWSSWPP